MTTTARMNTMTTKPFSYDFLLNVLQDLAISEILYYQPETAQWDA
jgi:hypothetical protein